jgi:hypothetical protein
MWLLLSGISTARNTVKMVLRKQKRRIFSRFPKQLTFLTSDYELCQDNPLPLAGWYAINRLQR